MEKGTRKGISAERNEKEVNDGLTIKREKSDERNEEERGKERGSKTRRAYRTEYVEEEEEEENGPCAARTPGYRQGVS